MARLARLVAFLGLVGLLVPLGGSAGRAGAQGERAVTASAHCADAGAGGQPEVEVVLANRTGAPLTVGYVYGFTSPEAFAIQMRMADQVDQPPVVVPDGASRTLRAPWDDLGQGPGAIGGALVVTNAGALIPFCGDRPADADEIRLGSLPASPEAARR